MVTAGAKWHACVGQKMENISSSSKNPFQEVADVTGAGDTVLAVLAYPIHEGYDVFDACEKACCISRAVEHRGVHVVSVKKIYNVKWFLLMVYLTYCMQDT